jgi:RNA polymerase sigma-70 factor (ECF subfamily)
MTSQSADALQSHAVTDEELATIASEWRALVEQAWPGVGLDRDAFVAQVLQRLPAETSIEVARALHVADLWLAAGCASGDPVALAGFDANYLAPLGGLLAPTGLAPDQIDEVRQELRRKLLVAEEGQPRIADYSGRADLRIWLRTAATRAAIDLIRKQRDIPAEDEDLAALPAIADDPELAHLRERYRDELRDAIVQAMTAITPRERLLLKYHYVDGFGIDRLAEIFGVHRTTTARWLNSARESLADHTHRLLIAKLRVTASELRSIARLVESQLDLSVRRLLA